MQIKVDWEADVLYVLFDEDARLDVGEEMDGGVVLDLDAAGKIVGIEVQGLSAKCGDTKDLSNLLIRGAVERKAG